MTSRIPAFFLLIAAVLLAFVPRAEGVIHTGMGRFLQADPHASGLVLIDDPAWFHGNGRVLNLDQFDLETRYRDGANLYQYLASNPGNNTDPLGLFVAGMASGVLQSMLLSLGTEYAANLEADVAWATDWDMGDDWHSRLDNSWVDWALLQGFADYFGVTAEGVQGLSDNPWMTFANARSLRGGHLTGVAGSTRSLYNFQRHAMRFGTQSSQLASKALDRIVATKGQALKGKGPNHPSLQRLFAEAQAAGWKITGRARGDFKGEGFRIFKGDKLILYRPAGKSKYHPEFGGGAYWKGASGQTGRWRVAAD